jgi:transcriptional activator SPT7
MLYLLVPRAILGRALITTHQEEAFCGVSASSVGSRQTCTSCSRAATSIDLKSNGAVMRNLQLPVCTLHSHAVICISRDLASTGDVQTTSFVQQNQKVFMEIAVARSRMHRSTAQDVAQCQVEPRVWGGSLTTWGCAASASEKGLARLLNQPYSNNLLLRLPQRTVERQTTARDSAIEATTPSAYSISNPSPFYSHAAGLLPCLLLGRRDTCTRSEAAREASQRGEEVPAKSPHAASDMSRAVHRPSSIERPHYARLPTQPLNAIRLRTPNGALSDEAMSNGSVHNTLGDGVDTVAEEDPRAARWREQYLRTEARLAAVLGGAHQEDVVDAEDAGTKPLADVASAAHDARPVATPKRPIRAIDEDDYGDDDDDADEDDANTSPLYSKSASNGIGAGILDLPSLRIPPSSLPSSQLKLAVERTNTPVPEPAKSSDDVRKQLQQDKKAAEDAAKRSFHTLFYTLESDRDAMLEQQKLDELDRQVETEMSGQLASAPAVGVPAAPQQGTLSTTNLGASSLTLKHLIARIDAQRDRVHASDAQLRSLISEVRKNRSKWANEDRVGQEELYESVEKVLMELKACEHAHPFLQRVNKREAPDYYNIIKQPMDIGTMMKKLKQLVYKSKKDFVDDLMLIWANCLKYNSDPAHPLRKKALYMRKETEKLVPLIPEITVRDRAEVEAEERRIRNGDADADGAEDSEDEEPIMASRGRKAPSKGGKGSSTARKAPPAGLEGTPGPETKPGVPSLNNAVSNLKNEFLRADSEMEGSVNGFSTPPPGTLTPLGLNGTARGGAGGSQADISDADGTGASVSGFTLEEDADLDDLEFKTWKQVTKKDRATIAAERHRLFHEDQLQVEEPAILRTKAGMRRWLRHKKQATEEEAVGGAVSIADGKDGAQATAGESLAEGIEGEEERQIPDYYDPVCAIPDLNERLQWVEDAEGHVIQQFEEYMRIVPRGQFIAPDSSLAKRMGSNMRQMQETRKICSKIGIVKQMQLQTQVCSV